MYPIHDTHGAPSSCSPLLLLLPLLLHVCFSGDACVCQHAGQISPRNAQHASIHIQLGGRRRRGSWGRPEGTTRRLIDVHAFGVRDMMGQPLVPRTRSTPLMTLPPGWNLPCLVLLAGLLVLTSRCLVLPAVGPK
jgi:hypothetical protein